MAKAAKNGILIHIFEVFVMLPKLPIFSILFLMSLSYVSLAAIIPIRFLRTTVIPKVYMVIFRALLFLTGLYEIGEQYTSLVDRYSAISENEQPNPGDIIVANFSSYLNLMWLQSKFNPIFVIPASDDEVVQVSFFALLFCILQCKPTKNGKKKRLCDLVELSKKEKRPLVLFPEASVTNGEHIFKFYRFGDGVDLSETKFHIYGFVHFGSRISPNFVRGNGFVHLLQMIGRIFAGLNVKIALEQEIPKSESNKIDDKWISRTREVLSKITGLPLIEMDAKDVNSLSSNKKIY